MILVLVLLNLKDLFILDMNVLDFVIGVEFMYVQEGEECVIVYGSFSFILE